MHTYINRSVQLQSDSCSERIRSVCLKVKYHEIMCCTTFLDIWPKSNIIIVFDLDGRFESHQNMVLYVRHI